MTDTPATTAVCRHEFDCDGWTVDPLTSVCRVCGQSFVFWSNPASINEWRVYLTPEEWADVALANAKVKKTRRRFLHPHITRAIARAIEDDRHARR